MVAVVNNRLTDNNSIQKTFFIRTNFQKYATKDADCVISDGATSADNKIVHYSLPKDMTEGYIAIYSRENDSLLYIVRHLQSQISLKVLNL
jgi:hypothetical protein